MTDKSLGVVSIGNALVDIISHVNEEFLESQNNMVKGTMALIDDDTALALTSALDDPITTSGGSAANTMAGYASFGGKGGFIGKVADDAMGAVYKSDLSVLGVQDDVQILGGENNTGRCVILVTPDGERTMNTFLGASVLLAPEDISETMIAQAQILYMEGYLFDKDMAKQAFIHAAQLAKKNGVKVALTLSDPFCVDRHRDDFINLVENHVDILFANEDEIKGLYQVERFDEAIDKVAGKVKVAALTRSEKGACIIEGGQRYNVDAVAVDNVVDTTGAGDQFAAGFLYGITHGFPVDEAAKMGVQAAAEVISHIGPRPLTQYAEFLDKAA